jgi:hypothetical protein
MIAELDTDATSPVGATSVSMHVLRAMQLMVAAEGVPAKAASIAAAINTGGAVVAKNVRILERRR